MKKIKEAIVNYMEKYGAELAAGYVGGNLNPAAIRNLWKEA